MKRVDLKMFYELMLEVELHLKNLVTFNIIYLTNKYNMSFDVFVGINHQGHSTLLGYGLNSNEDIKTFI